MHVSITTGLHENVPFSSIVHRLSGPNSYVLTQNALKIRVRFGCGCVVGVLLRVGVSCCVCWRVDGCVVVWWVCGCVWLWSSTLKKCVHIDVHVHVGVTLFCSFYHEKSSLEDLLFHDVCFSEPVTFHKGFMCVPSRSCFKHFSRLQATPL